MFTTAQHFFDCHLSMTINNCKSVQIYPLDMNRYQYEHIQISADQALDPNDYLRGVYETQTSRVIT